MKVEFIDLLFHAENPFGYFHIKSYQGDVLGLLEMKGAEREREREREGGHGRSRK